MASNTSTQHIQDVLIILRLYSKIFKNFHLWLYQFEQEVKVIWQKAPHGGPIPRLEVTPGGRKLYHW